MHSREERMKPSVRSSCVKIYLCSNPEDSAAERRALGEQVFPKFREHCRHRLGLDVRVIDPFESSDPRRWPDEISRQQLITECRESSAGLFLLALVGHQYGAASLPTQVEVTEFQLLLQESQRAGVSTQELERVYRRDENSAPPSYCRRHSRCPQVIALNPAHQAEDTEEDRVKIKLEEDELMKVFQTAVSACVRSSLMTSQRAQTYWRSALDADLRFALENRADGDVTRRCLVYVHKVVNAKGDREKLSSQSEGSSLDVTADGLFSQLCDSFLPSLITSSQLLVYSTTTVCDQRLGYTATRRRGYAESLCRQVYADLIGLTGSVSADVPLVCDAVAGVQEEQEELCDLLSSFYDISRPEEEKVQDHVYSFQIRAYVKQSEHRLPLVVVGGPCTGKAVLVAHCARQINAWLPHCDPVVIPYFCTFSTNSCPKQLLMTLCYQIASRYKRGTSFSEQNPSHEEDLDCSSRSNSSYYPECFSGCSRNKAPCLDPCGLVKPDAGLSELKERLSSLLTLRPSPTQPLFLILDGLDHVEKTFGPQVLASLPSPLPPSVKIVLTVSSARTQILQSVTLRDPLSEGRGPGCVCVTLGGLDRKQCVKMVTSLLRSSGRRVTSGQQVLVNQALSSCCLPLYGRLLHLHTALWRSDSDVAESSLPDGVHSSISLLLDHLEQKHGRSVVARAVSYLALSRSGLTEAELADLLSSDEQVLSAQRVESPPVVVLQVDVEKLLLDLRRFLVRRTVTGLHVLSWVSRHFKLVVMRRYLATHEVRREIHSVMAGYFSEQWACGRANPSPANQRSLPNNDTTECNQSVCKQPSSPLFDFASSSNAASRLTLRKVLEVPHHLQRSNSWEEFERRLLMFAGFHQAMIHAGLLGDLVAMLEAEEGLSHGSSRERALLASILKSTACLLHGSPLQLSTAMETNLVPYLDVFPALRVYIREIREERRKKGSGLGVLLCPAPSSVPSIHCLKCDDKSGKAAVAEVAGTECGIIAEVMDDGTAWFWKGSSGCSVARLLLSCEREELKFAGVKSSAQFVLLSTRCDRHFLWDVTGPEMFLQLREPLKSELEPESKTQAANTVEGFVAWQKKVFLWRKGESSVCMFDVSNETTTQFRCESHVSCLVCSSDGSYMYCGQENGSVSVFEMDAGKLLSTWSVSNHSAVTLMILCEEKWELACVDRTGNVTLWAAAVQPPRLLTESFTGDEENNVLSTDYVDDIHTLLVCQSHQVTLWGTCDWELWDQFLAPQGRAFAEAVLAQDGNIFLALLDTCHHVLVWRVSTGECVLSLETETRPCTLLKTITDVVCVGHDGCLTTWSLKMITAAGAAPKMGFAVSEVAVEQTGEWFYTRDGSEMVWRWRLGIGLPHNHFLHDGPVVKLRLSPDDVHLVTLSAGEIYVWKTETGQNIVRVSGSRATDILITPNSNFGVSISERWLSQVWKLAHGSIVCSIRLHLSDAQVSPESTFLIGRRCGDLLAASLWSGSISKRFSCVVSSEHVVAFQTLSGYPDFVVVMVASGALYTWKVAEETVCRHFQLPHTFHCQPSIFQMSSNGSFALLSTKNRAINLLNLAQVTLCSVKAEGPVIEACLDKTGRYAAYITGPASSDRSCMCSLHMRPLLTVVRLADGERMGSVRLLKNPSTLLVSKSQCVFVGFEDGTVAVYSVSDAVISGEEPLGCGDDSVGRLKDRPLDRWLPLISPNVTWH